MNNEINDLFLSLLSYIEHNDYRRANNLALKLYDIDSRLICNTDFTKERIDDIVVKLLLHSIEVKPEITNLLAYQYVCFGICNGISKIINLSCEFCNLSNSGLLNNLAIAYFKTGDNKKTLELQRAAVNNADYDLLRYNDQKDLIYYNEFIYELIINKRTDKKNIRIIQNVLSSEYVYDLEAALIVSMISDDYKYFCSNYKPFNSVMAFDDEISSIFPLYYKKRVCPTIEDVQKYLNPIAIYDELFYDENI